MYARRDLAVDEEIITAIPFKACLSARTCAAAELLRAEQLGGGLALNIAIMHELWLGEKSRWAGYFAILPKGGERTLPMFWPDDLLAELEGTDLLMHVEDDKKNMREDFTEHVLEGLVRRFPETFPPDTFTFEMYLEAASVSASRAFFIGDDAGEALVPWADMFNHRTDSEHVNVLGADEEEGEEGDEEEGDDEEEGKEDEGEEEDDDEEGDDDNEEDEDEEEEEEETSPIEPPEGKLVIHTIRPAKTGDELFNTFGQQNNASLLHKYGFCEVNNAHTTVTIDASLVIDVVGPEVREAAESLLIDLDEEPYFEIAPDGQIEDALRDIVQRALKFQKLDQKGNKTNRVDVSEDVRVALRSIIDRRLGMYTRAEPKEMGAADDTNPPAGGGVVGRAAAIVLRRGEQALLQRAVDLACENEPCQFVVDSGHEGGVKRKRRS